jgi:GMP synthase (glutamine-hydrolysing)
MIVILDFGSQYTQLIARAIREENVYCEIYPYNCSLDKIAQADSIKGFILSGGYASVYKKNAPHPDKRIWSWGVPILGICYGMQLICENFSGKVKAAKKREYGTAEIQIVKQSPLLKGLNKKEAVWASHGDEIAKTPSDFTITAKSANNICQAFENKQKQIYGVQFHPEVKHTPRGRVILRNFIFNICGQKKDWNMHNYIALKTKELKEQIGNAKVLCALSGGVDSSVAAVLVHKIIGKNLICVYVDTGLQRLGETERVKNIFSKKFKANLKIIDAKKLFLAKLKNISDPERKRKIIGKTFIEVFDAQAKKFKGVEYLLQGTIYPDIIESASVKGIKVPIKSHHNVGGLPKQMKLNLVEPLKSLFKDEVRLLGAELGMPGELLSRQPFPGPGLGIRILGAVSDDKLKILKQADYIVEQEVRAYGLYEKTWQTFAVLLPIKTVGVMGDARTYEYVIVLRAVNSVDAMTADWAHLPYDLLERISSKIINEVKGANRVVYDISNKPPATIEWE